ncbi:hypothetical protein, partial [Salmonella sp. E393-2]|uniref:hypothetical protein n=1 Tax=Salmonella sp. E393-2 TaxID=3240324 RepID=UPI00352B7779
DRSRPTELTEVIGQVLIATHDMVDTTSNRIRGDPPTMQPYCIIDIQNSGRLGKKLKSWNCREKLSLKDHNVTSVRADYLRKAVKQFSQQPKRAI